MKAVILAGGEGSRLRPLTLGRCKPMTPLFGKPVMGHIIDLLRRHGVTEIAVTLHYLPSTVMDFFGDGSDYGVHLHYVVEDVPVGTAGSVKMCMDFLGDEDFLVVSGDAVTDLDLTELTNRHLGRSAAASLALCRREEPLEYGLVRCDRSGTVLGFVEKPGWSQVSTELVNTGIYVLSRRAMDLVPEDTDFDFGKDLFPLLLKEGELLCGWEVPGYWQDMGDCGAYLESVRDALDGKVALDLVTGMADIPAGVEVRSPCWISRRVSLARGCSIGPYTVLGEGSTVETGAVVERSVLLGAHVGEGAEVTGAILCRGAAVHRRAMVNTGAVLGENVRVGSEAIVAPGVKLWPGRSVPEGGKATASQVTAGQSAPLKFTGSGLLRGTVGEELTPEALLSLGAILGERGRVGLGWSGGEGAAMLARCASCGVVSAGGTSLCSDAPCPSAAAWLSRYYELPVTIFVQQDGDTAQLGLYGADGLSLTRGEQRKIEGALLRGETSRVPALRVGQMETIAGVRAGYVAEAARRSRLSTATLGPVAVRVEMGEENDLLARALTILGCQVSRGEGRGMPTFAIQRGGFSLAVWDEEGKEIPPDRLLVLLTRIEMENGTKKMALPAWAPAAADTVAGSFGGRILRLGRDGQEAREVWRDLPWMWDGYFAACRICARMGLTGESLAYLDSLSPRFATVRGEVPLRSGRGRVMGAALAGHTAGRAPGDGARFPVGDGWVYLVPISSRRALRIIAEAASTEAAEELCGRYEEKIRQLDEE